MKNPDVLVIGGGVIGCAAAYYAVSRGLRTIVVEANDVAAGASGACDGFLCLQTKQPGTHLSLARTSIRLHATLSAELGADTEFERIGSLVVFTEPDQSAAYERRMTALRDAGVAVERLSPKELRQLVPALREGTFGAAFCASDAKVNVLELTFAFERVAKRLGARFITGERVTGFVLRGGRVTEVRTTGQRIAPGSVVNCCGAVSAGVAALVGERLPVKPRRGQLLVTEPVPAILPHLVLTGSYLTAKFAPDRAPVFGGVTLEQTRHGGILVGSTREFAGERTDVTLDAIESIARHATDLVPLLRDVHIIRTFAGLRPYCADGLPIIARSEHAVNLIHATGHGGDGVTLAPYTGRRVAELLEDTA